MKYEDQEVQIIRAAQPSDPGYDPDKEDQVLVRLPDGSEKVVDRTDLTQ